MIYSLTGDKISVKVNSKGAQLWSVRDKDNNEYLWQGDPAYWQDRAPNLFPYIGRLTRGTYRLNGKPYNMDIHGFLKDSELSLAYTDPESMIFSLKSSRKTREQYPCEFEVNITYQISGRELKVIYRVWNKDKKTIYFGVGGHPGFNLPFENTLDFGDYYIQFGKGDRPEKVGMSQDCFVTGETEAVTLEEGNRLMLYHGMFDHDAVILKGVSEPFQLRSPKGRKYLEMQMEGMGYLGLWHRPRSDAPYICMEPWSSLPSRKSVIEDLEHQDNLIRLDPGNDYSSSYEIRICEQMEV